MAMDIFPSPKCSQTLNQLDIHPPSRQDHKITKGWSHWKPKIVQNQTLSLSLVSLNLSVPQSPKDSLAGVPDSNSAGYIGVMKHLLKKTHLLYGKYVVLGIIKISILEVLWMPKIQSRKTNDRGCTCSPPGAITTVERAECESTCLSSGT